VFVWVVMFSMLIKVFKVIRVTSAHCWPLVLFVAPAFIGFIIAGTVISVVRIIHHRVNRVVRITRGF
jgi:hypothetical protein